MDVDWEHKCERWKGITTIYSISSLLLRVFLNLNFSISLMK